MWCVERELATNVSFVIHMLLYLLWRRQESELGGRGYTARVRWDCESRVEVEVCRNGRAARLQNGKRSHDCSFLYELQPFCYFFFTIGIEWQSVIIINDQIIPLISNSGTGTVSAARVIAFHSTCNLLKYKAWNLHLVSLYVFLKQRHIITIVNSCPESDMPGCHKNVSDPSLECSGSVMVLKKLSIVPKCQVLFMIRSYPPPLIYSMERLGYKNTSPCGGVYRVGYLLLLSTVQRQATTLTFCTFDRRQPRLEIYFVAASMPDTRCYVSFSFFPSPPPVKFNGDLKVIEIWLELGPLYSFEII